MYPQKVPSLAANESSKSHSKRKLDQLTDDDEVQTINTSVDIKSSPAVIEVKNEEDNELNPNKRFQQEDFDDWRLLILILKNLLL